MKTALFSYALTALIAVCMAALLAYGLTSLADLFGVVNKVFAQLS
jgi:hypothetical protein